MIKLLAIGDLHSKRSNQAELLECGRRIVAQINTTHPKAVIILGDLANDHEKLYLSALNGIVSVLDMICTEAAKVEAKVYYIIGNHDAQSNQIFLEDSHAFNAFKKWPNLIIVDTPIRLKSPDGYITMCPYVPNGRFVEALDVIGRDRWMESMVIFAHQEFIGAKYNNIESTHGDKWGELLPLVVSGHIHAQGVVGNNIIYAGAPYDINFGDDGQKGIHLFTFVDTKLVSAENIDLGMPRKITVKLTVEEAATYVPPENASIRAYVSGTTQDFIKFKKTEAFEVLAQKVKIVPQITDPIKLVKNVSRKGYIDILTEECKKENEHVRAILAEISQGEAQ